MMMMMMMMAFSLNTIATLTPQLEFRDFAKRLKMHDLENAGPKNNLTTC